jgi:hypothetical protein
MKKKLLLVLLSLFLFLAAISPAFAGDDELPELKAETHTIAVFKNGLGYFIKGGEVSPAGGWAVIMDIPEASHGSIWIGSPDAGTVVDEAIGMKGFFEEKSSAVSILDILSANIGKKIAIRTDIDFKGTLALLLWDKTSERQAPQGMIYQPSLAAIDTDAGTTIIRIEDIKEVAFPDGKPVMSKSIKLDAIRIHIDSRMNPVPVSLSYISRDILWAPSYIINIMDPKKASITMQAVLVNDAEDISGADVFFVVGYPNFAYANVMSPLAMKDSVAQFISAMQNGGASQRNYNSYSNAMVQTSAGYDRISDSFQASPGYTVETGTPGESNEDLFFYKKENVTLPRGGRAYYNIFSGQVDYEHVYEWKIPDTNNIDWRGYYRGEQVKNDTKEQVWHTIKLSNSTPYPWTTAPAISFSGWKPLAQDMLEYTPTGTNQNLKLTIASDVKVDRNEIELERVHDSKVNSGTYDLVTVKGTLSIRNTKHEDIAMEIEKSIVGKVTSADNGGKVSVVVENLQGINQNSTVKWQLPVPAGKSVELTYKYTVYVTR